MKAKVTKVTLLVAFLIVFLGSAFASTWTAASCNTADVQNVINSASSGDTVNIPAGTCAWTTGVTISGKGITVQGAGSGRIIGYSSSTMTIGTGSKSLTISSTNVVTSPTISAGQTLTVFETGTSTNNMTGTVTSYNSSTGALVMNITSSNGSCGSNHLSNCKRWLVSTPSSTVIVNNSTTNDLFAVTESTAASINISGIKFGNFGADAGGAHEIDVFYTSGGQPVLLHDCWVQLNSNNSPPPSGNGTPIYWNTNRGVIWNCSFDSSPYSQAGNQDGAISQQDDNNLTGNSWTSVSNMGSLDSDGKGELFVETNDFHAFLFASNTDSNGRQAFRYNLVDNGGAFGTHGADTSTYGQRYFEFYNNVMNFNGYADGTTFNIPWWIYLRGGTTLVYNNVIPSLVSTDYGTKSDIGMIVMNLQRNAGPNPCWGAGTSNGANYHAPRQVGYGYVTGSGLAPNNGGERNDSITYVGDSEPIYIWGNSIVPLPNVNVQDYGGSGCTNPDSSVNYIVAGRDFFNGTTAKPGWSPYTYPHPLTQGSGSPPSPPANLQAIPQ